jgi:hypothetical protein
VEFSKIGKSDVTLIREMRVDLFVCLFIQRSVQLQSDRHFLLRCIHTNKFISYSGSQIYMAASFSSKESQQTRRRVVGGPFLMGGHFRNSLLSDLVFPANASSAVI